MISRVLLSVQHVAVHMHVAIKLQPQRDHPAHAESGFVLPVTVRPRIDAAGPKSKASSKPPLPKLMTIPSPLLAPSVNPCQVLNSMTRSLISPLPLPECVR
jgi:hypothetical protein